MELVESFRYFDIIILVDASLQEPDYSFQKLEFRSQPGPLDSHQLSADFLAALLEQLYPGNRDMYVCAIQGSNFEMGEMLSPSAKQNAVKALKAITAFLQEKGLVPGN